MRRILWGVACCFPLISVAADSSGRTETSSPPDLGVSASTSSTPGISFSSPKNYASVDSPGQLTVTVDAHAGAGASVTRVDFYEGETLILERASPPYALTWNIAGQGAKTLFAEVTDSEGRKARTPALVVSAKATAPMALQIDPGIVGATVNSDSVLVRGTIQAPLNSRVFISDSDDERLLAVGTITDDGQFFFNNVALKPGPNSLRVTGVDIDGVLLHVPLTITSAAVAPFEFSTSDDDGLLSAGPFPVAFDMRNLAAIPWDQTEVSCDGSGVSHLTIIRTNEEKRLNLGSCAYTLPGVFSPRISVFKRAADGTLQLINTHQAMVWVYSSESLDARLQGVIAMAFSRLATSNVDAAVKLFSAEVEEKYRNSFSALGKDLSPLISSFSAPQAFRLSAESATYLIERDTPQGKTVGPMLLNRSEKGAWRISGM